MVTTHMCDRSEEVDVESPAYEIILTAEPTLTLRPVDLMFALRDASSSDVGEAVPILVL